MKHYLLFIWHAQLYFFLDVEHSVLGKHALEHEVLRNSELK